MAINKPDQKSILNEIKGFLKEGDLSYYDSKQFFKGGKTLKICLTIGDVDSENEDFRPLGYPEILDLVEEFRNKHRIVDESEINDFPEIMEDAIQLVKDLINSPAIGYLYDKNMDLD